MLGGLGLPELIVIGIIVVLIFGPRQLPKMGKAFGETIREARNIRKQFDEVHEDAKDVARTVERETREVLK